MSIRSGNFELTGTRLRLPGGLLALQLEVACRVTMKPGLEIARDPNVAGARRASLF